MHLCINDILTIIDEDHIWFPKFLILNKVENFYINFADDQTIMHCLSSLLQNLAFKQLIFFFPFIILNSKWLWMRYQLNQYNLQFILIEVVFCMVDAIYLIFSSDVLHAVSKILCFILQIHVAKASFANFK